jgi:hypothetical protein
MCEASPTKLCTNGDNMRCGKTGKVLCNSVNTVLVSVGINQSTVRGSVSTISTNCKISMIRSIHLDESIMAIFFATLDPSFDPQVASLATGAVRLASPQRRHHNPIMS